jgi:hypothetical protein
MDLAPPTAQPMSVILMERNTWLEREAALERCMILDFCLLLVSIAFLPSFAVFCWAGLVSLMVGVCYCRYRRDDEIVEQEHDRSVVRPRLTDVLSAMPRLGRMWATPVTLPETMKWHECEIFLDNVAILSLSLLLLATASLESSFSRFCVAGVAVICAGGSYCNYRGRLASGEQQ